MPENGPRTVALVTGAGQGIGLGIARALCGAGLKVALTDINAQTVKASAAQLAADGHDTLDITLDVSRWDDWTRAVAVVQERWGRLDVLVNNAGISPRGTVESTDEALWDRTLAINLKGPWLGIKAFLPLLKASRGTVINVGTTRATRPLPGLFPYVTSKAGLFGMTQQVAVECLGTGPTCNMVAPGWVDTPGERIIQAAHGRPDFPNDVENLTTSEEIGAAVVYLASSAASKINGVILYLDSGMHVADDAGMIYLPHVRRDRYHTPGMKD
jgi:3-oxoacyl-[acyl-carrier protein] reductase